MQLGGVNRPQWRNQRMGMVLGPPGGNWWGSKKRWMISLPLGARSWRDLIWASTQGSLGADWRRRLRRRCSSRGERPMRDFFVGLPQMLGAKLVAVLLIGNLGRKKSNQTFT